MGSKINYFLVLHLLVLLHAAHCGSAPLLQQAEGIAGIEPKIAAHVKKVVSANDPSGLASGYISSIIHGDIDGNQTDDVFVSFSVAGIGGGNFSLLFQALFLKQGDSLQLVSERGNGQFGTAQGETFVPERISPGRILGLIHEYAPGDGVCCPSIKRKAVLVFKNGVLVEQDEAI